MNALSLFSGIGGLDLAAERAGFKTVAFCERDEFCQKVLAKHWPEVRIFDDVRTIDTSELPAIELLHGGFPCQPYSRAGKRCGNDDSRALWPELLRVVRATRPNWIVGENVPGIIELALDGMLSDLEAEDYEVRAVITPACAVNAKHRRERVWIVANAKNELRRSEDGSVGSGKAKGGSEAQGWALRQGLRNPVHDGFGASFEFGRGNRWATPSSRVCGRADGIPRIMDRHRAIGNAVVPQQAYPIFAAIAETYNVELTGTDRRPG